MTNAQLGKKLRDFYDRMLCHVAAGLVPIGKRPPLTARILRKIYSNDEVMLHFLREGIEQVAEDIVSRAKTHGYRWRGLR